MMPSALIIIMFLIMLNASMLNFSMFTVCVVSNTAFWASFCYKGFTRCVAEVV